MMNRIRHVFGVSVLLVSAGLALNQAAHAESADVKNFLMRRADKLFDGDREFRFVSVNVPNLMVIEDAFEFTRPNPWRWPDEFEIEDSLESVRQMGGQVVRTYVLSVYREGADMGECVHVRQPGKFNEAGFRALDRVIEVARRKGIRVIIPFVDQAKWWGGIAEYAAFRGKRADAFWRDPQLIDDFKATIRHLLTRKNVYTGIEYRNEPAIFGWETGNEIDPPAEWTREIAAFIKQLDKKHLVLDGKSLHGLPLASLDDPNIDIVSTHHYPWGEDHDFAKPIREAHALTKGKKAYLVGEFGFVETPHIASATQTTIDDGISGALLWSLRMHRREGGFYWHMEVGTGRNIYKAFHWPGFPSGDRYDEQTVMKLVRDKAYEIRGLKPPKLERPAPPKLLPIEKVSAISWQGSAGAASYDVERASDVNGPWGAIARNSSDGDVQYRPLLNDDSAIPGREYWYRVVARNPAGDSDPSNTVGPVSVHCRTLVDECRDNSLVAKTEGKVLPTSDNARTVQEDCHRLAMQPGSAIVYRVELPINRWQIFSFAPAEANLAFSVSSDGKNYRTVPVERTSYPSSQTVYGYLTPILFKGKLKAGDFNFLRIANPDQGRKTNSQADTSNGTKSSPVEISRSEIEFGSDATLTASAHPKRARMAAQLNSAIFVDGTRPLNETLVAIDGAAQRGERQLNVVVTILVDLTDDFHIKSFGGRDPSTQRYMVMDDTMRQTLSDELRQVFKRMIERKMSINILPHIDAGGKVRTWRNWVDFDPLERYSAYTYADLMLDTIVDALAKTATPETGIAMALSGEMGASLFRHPASYRRVVRQLRERSDLKRLRLGVSLNHGGIAGQRNPTGAKDVQLTGETRRDMQTLIEDCDFIGMSFYAPVSVSPTPADFVRGIDRFMNEFKQLGLSVPTTKPMQFSEAGIGGRRLRNGEQPSPQKAVESPWEGTTSPANNPWRDDAMRSLRRTYHTALLDFLNKQPARWQVEAAFFWSMGSWDPIGQRDPEFADPEISDDVERHNRAITLR
jgi:mannan endo-1,4-beta-mannosidase